MDTENTVQRNGTTARQRAIIAAEKAKSAAAMDAAKKEESARNADITVVATSYDATTGDWVASTPDGGTVRAQSLTNGSLSGLRLPLQRFSGSQTARINAPPTDADSGWVVTEMESMQRDIVSILPPQLQDIDPDDVGRFPRDVWVNRVTQSAFVWDADTSEWIGPIGGGGRIFYGQGDPNLSATTVEWQPNSHYYDTRLNRAYYSAPPDQTGLWLPAAPHVFNPQTINTADAFYINDLYQGPTDHEIEDAEGGMFYRLGPDGWVPQFSCCEEVPEPPDSCTTNAYEQDLNQPLQERLSQDAPGWLIDFLISLRVPCS